MAGMDTSTAESSPPFLPRFLAATAEDLANRVLRLDPDTLERLAAFDGKLIRLCYQPPGSGGPLSWYVLPFAGGLRLRLSPPGEPDVTISGNLPAFGRMLFGDLSPLSAPADMQIRGDIELGQRFKQVLDQVDPDWEEPLSRVLGDTLAHKAGRLLAGLQDWSRRTRGYLQADLADYLKEEAELVPRREEVERFVEQVGALRADVERLAQRLQRLKDRT